ncbi:MAG: hypothetical protein ACHQYP_09120 [Nitrospiria bacterium]
MEDKLISLSGMKKNPENGSISRYFVEYLRDIGLIQGVKIPYKTGKRMIYKYTPQEASIIQSVWYFREKGFDLSKSVELAQKSLNRRNQERAVNDLFPDLGA